MPQFISREKARQKIAELFIAQRDLLDERFRCMFVVPIDRWHRRRNYEIEYLLREWFGGNWVINELCPFNGEYCRWGEDEAQSR